MVEDGKLGRRRRRTPSNTSNAHSIRPFLCHGDFMEVGDDIRVEVVAALDLVEKLRLDGVDVDEAVERFMPAAS